MKKKLFLAILTVALFACLFAISVGASGFVSDYTSEVTKFYDGSTEIKPDWADLSDTSATAVLKKADETYVRIPLYYIYQANGSTELRHEIRTKTGSAGFRYDWIGTQLGQTFTHASLVALDIPEGIKTTSGLGNYTALKEVVFPLTATGFPKSEKHPTLEKVFAKQQRQADGTIKGITTVASYSFKNVTTLEYFKLELDYVTYIGENSFLNTAVKELRFEGPFTGMGSAPFGGCAKLEEIYINNLSANRVNGGQMFSGNHVLREAVLNGIDLPDYAFQGANGLADGGLTIVATNVGVMGLMAFKNMVNLSSVEISGPITSIGSSLFTGCSNLTSVKIVNTSSTPASCGSSMCSSLKKLQRVELQGISIGEYAFRDAGAPEGLTIICTNVGSIGKEAFAVQGGKSGNVKTVDVSGNITSIGGNLFLNNKTVVSAIIRVVGNPFSDATSVGGVSSIVSKATYEGSEDAYATGKHIVYGYNVCELLYGGNHLTPEETYDFTSFTEKSYLRSVCSRCQSGTVLKEVEPLFVVLGFSAAQYGDAIYSVNYRVNDEAIEAYMEITGETVNYGVFAVKAETIGKNDIFDENGDERQGVIAADLTDAGFGLVNLKIMGFNEEQKKTPLAMGAYVKTEKDGTVKYSYVQIKPASAGEKYYFASYNDVAALLDEENA
jgi:hypothetical protein